MDIHKDYLVWVAVDERQNILEAPQRVNYRHLSAWKNDQLRSTDAVVLEASTNAWDFYDQLVPLVCQVTVAHPGPVRWIASSLIKTDKRDALVLARLLAANLIPPVWVPRTIQKLGQGEIPAHGADPSARHLGLITVRFLVRAS